MTTGSRIDAGVAPSASRRPISAVRWRVACAMTPYKPTAASNSAMPLSTPTNVAIARCSVTDRSSSSASRRGRVTATRGSRSRTACRMAGNVARGSPAVRTCSVTAGFVVLRQRTDRRPARGSRSWCCDRRCRATTPTTVAARQRDQALPNRIGVRPQPVRERPAHDRDARLTSVAIRGLKSSSADEGDAHRLQIAVAHDIGACGNHVAPSRRIG